MSFGVGPARNKWSAYCLMGQGDELVVVGMMMAVAPGRRWRQAGRGVFRGWTGRVRLW